MDILNFISWIKGSRVVNSVDASQTLLPVGLKDPKRDDGYLAGAISVADFASAIVPTYSNCNIPIGEDALLTIKNSSIITSFSSNNIAIGCNAGKMLNPIFSSAYNNVIIGNDSLSLSDRCADSVIIGSKALRENSSSHYKAVVIGESAGLYLSQSDGDVIIGSEACGVVGTTTYSKQNVIIGYSAGYEASGGLREKSVYIGYNAGQKATGDNNIYIGNLVACTSTYMYSTGTYNTIVGGSGNFASERSFGKATTATENCGFGVGVLRNATTARRNVAIGTYALGGVIEGLNNTAIGHQSGNGFESTECIYIGALSSNDGPGYQYSVAIGSDAQITASNQFVIGTAAKNIGTVTTEVNNTSSKVWNVVINGVARKILLA